MRSTKRTYLGEKQNLDPRLQNAFARPSVQKKSTAGTSFSSLTGNLNLKLISVGQIVGLAAAIGLASWHRQFSDFFHALTFRDTLLVTLFSFPLVACELFIFSKTAQRYHFVRQTIESQLSGPEGRVLKSKLLLACFFIVAGAFTEETLSRGFVQEHVGLWASVVCSAGITFINLPQFFAMALVGLCEGLLYELTRHNLVCPIIAHLIFNGTGLFLLKKHQQKLVA